MAINSENNHKECKLYMKHQLKDILDKEKEA